MPPSDGSSTTTRRALLEAGTGSRLHHWPVENVGSQPVVVDGTVLYRAWDVSDTVRIG